MTEDKEARTLIHAQIFNPKKALFKEHRNDRAECTTVYCSASERCGLFASLRIQSSQTERKNMKKWIVTIDKSEVHVLEADSKDDAIKKAKKYPLLMSSYAERITAVEHPKVGKGE